MHLDEHGVRGIPVEILTFFRGVAFKVFQAQRQQHSVRGGAIVSSNADVDVSGRPHSKIPIELSTQRDPFYDAGAHPSRLQRAKEIASDTQLSVGKLRIRERIASPARDHFRGSACSYAFAAAPPR